MISKKTSKTSSFLFVFENYSEAKVHFEYSSHFTYIIIVWFQSRVMSDSNIHICCWNGTLDGLNELIAAGGVDINESGEYGNTPLHRASRNGHSEAVNVLVRAGAEVNKTNEFGGTPLYYASDNGHLEVVNVLVAAGAEVNKTNNNGNTPLHDASENGRLEVVNV